MCRMYFLIAFIFAGQLCLAQQSSPPGPRPQEDIIAENILLWQRNCGGWPKDTYSNYYDDKISQGDAKPGAKVLIDYKKEFTPAQKQLASASKKFTDATIDNGHTTSEIRYLLQAFEKTYNAAYLSGAEKGLQYLLEAQYDNGGWPQFYPDMRSYRHQVTFNDNAMANVMHLLKDITESKNYTAPLNKTYAEKAQKAFEKGIDIILKTQLKQNGQLTAWCAQYDEKTLQPATARSYELPSVSGNESVEIVRLLMRVEHPSGKIIQAVEAAVKWFESVKIEDYKVERIKDSTQPKGINAVVIPADGAVMWARFYDLHTNQPFFSDRDGVKKHSLAEIGIERRTGYGWYGDWPKKLVTVEYPAWKKNHQL